MKKILSIALVVFMLFACVPFSASAADYGYGWQWGSAEAYGYCQDTGVQSTNVKIEYVASVVADSNGADWAMWSAEGGHAKIDAANGYVTIEGQASTPYAWGELAHDNWHHIAYVYEDGNCTFVIDGEEIATYSGVKPDTNSYLFFANNGVLTIDDWKISDLDGNVLFEEDFEGSEPKFNAGLGAKFALLSDPYAEGGAEVVMSKAAYVNGGYVDRNGYSFGQSQTIEFDLWLYDDASGIQFWADSAVTRYTFAKTYVGVNIAGGGSAYGDTDDYAGIEFGDTGFLTPNWHTFKLEMNVDGADRIYMDGELVWTGRTTANSYWGDRIILNAIGNGVAFDNFSINGQSWDFENSDSGIFGGDCTLVDVVVEGAGEVECPHLATEEKVDVAPTCQTEGVMGIYCINADCTVEGGRVDEYAIATVDHAWPDESNCSYENGSKVWYCTYDCGATASASIPAEDSYTGDLWYYYDMEDATATQKIQGFFDAEGLVVENGVGHMVNGFDGSYHQNPHDSKSNTSWSVTFDFLYEGIYDTGDTANYGHRVYFWFGGSSGMANEAGYDFEKGCFFIQPANDAQTYAAYEEYVELTPGEWYTIKFTYDCPGEDAYFDEGAINYCSFELNGEKVIRFSDDFEAAFQLPSTAKLIILRTFGVEAYIDNYAVGSADFAWVEEEEVLLGDVNGDGNINVRDLLFLKKYIAGVISIDDIAADLADINGDGEIGAKDSMALKQILVK